MWWPCQIHVLSQKITGGAVGRGAKLGGALPKLRILCPKTTFFGPKRSRNPLQTDKRMETLQTLHVHLNFSMTSSPLLPSDSTIFPRNGPKMAKNCLNVHCLCQTAPKRRMGHVLGYAAQNGTPRAPGPPTTPLFCGFQPSKSPNETPRPLYRCSLGGAQGPPHGGGQRWATKVPGRKKSIFAKLFLDLFGCSHKCF